MVKLSLVIKAELSNVTDLRPAEDDHSWNFKIKCTSCHEVDKNSITIAADTQSKVSGSRGEANLVMRCKNCKREGSVSIISDPVPYTLEDSETKKPVLDMEWRGLEPVEFEPRDGWVAKGADSPTIFDIDLTDREWYDYDEEASTEVSITEMSFYFEHTKDKKKK
ncbi:hypothetical protein GGI05_004574 [Coemansia sp. RSA 2603]|nr:hypothetical protein GGI05_004574 [Coemansia sp. RSA 2603]